MSLVLGLGGVPGASGQIVYQHGPDIWVMNDDGSSQHLLVSAQQVPGMAEMLEPQIFPDGGSAVAFVGRTNQFLQYGQCGINCEGLYTLSGGTLTRLSGAPAFCPSCSTLQSGPRWTASGQIMFRYAFSQGAPPCVFPVCVTEEKLELASATPGAQANEVPLGHPAAYGESIFTARPDPADANTFSYVGAYRCIGGACGYPIILDTGGSETEIGEDDRLLEAAWSAGGTLFADVEGGGERGIWTYGAALVGSKYGNPSTWAMEDPIQTGSPNDVTVKSIGWIGTSRIVFSANNNIWTIPASCGMSGSPCHFPKDATQLTSDGTTSAPDLYPSWTSDTQPLAGITPPSSPPPSSSPPLPSAPPLARATGALGRVRVHGGTIEVTLNCKGPAAAKCAMTVRLRARETLRASHLSAVQARRRRRPQEVIVTLASGAATFAGGHSITLVLHLNHTGRALLRQLRTLHASLIVSQTAGGSSTMVAKRSLILRSTKRHR